MHKLSLIGALAALTACNIAGVRPGSQIGSETDGCGLTHEEPVTDMGGAPEGFEITPDEVLLALGAFGGQVTRTSGEVLDLELTLTQDGQPSVWRMDLPADAMIEVACSDLIAVPARLNLNAADALQEDLEVTVIADQSGLITLFAQVDAGALQGDAAPDNLAPEELAETWFNVTADFDGAGWVGQLDFWGETYPEGSGDEAAVSAMSDPWGDFEAQPVE